MNSVLRFQNVSFSYPNGHRALRDVSFDILRGERVGLLGLNGSGKSTLMLHADALLWPDQGTVAVNGVAVTRRNAAECRRDVGMVFQNADDQLFMPTVEDDVAFGPRNMGLSDKEVADRVDEALRLTGCEALRGRVPFQLSGGQQKMVSVATVLSMHPEILILDEPSSGLDYAARAQLVAILQSLPHTLLMSSHDFELIKTLCSRVILLEDGEIVYDGDIADVPFPR